MQDNFLANLKNYLSIVTLKKFNLFDYIEKGDDSLKPIYFLLKYKDAFRNSAAVQSVFDRLLISFHSLDTLESEKAKKHELSLIAKERKNIQTLQKSIITTKNIFDSIEDKQTSNKLNILEHIFKLFEENDEATIELICTAKYIASIIIDSGNTDIELFRHHVKGMDNVIKNKDDLSFLASLAYYFEGYRLTKDMLLHSLAIKLFNFPKNAYHGEQFNLSEIAKSVENLLAPFSETEKFRVLPSRARNFYIKSFYKGQYILAYIGKKDKERFSYLFNPEAFYLPSKNNWTKTEFEDLKIGEAYFESAEDYHKTMSALFRTSLIFSR